jgi:hypothetical protein
MAGKCPAGIRKSVGKKYIVLGKITEVLGGISVISVTGQMIGPESIQGNKNNITMVANRFFKNRFNIYMQGC